MKTLSISIILFLLTCINQQAKELRVFSPSSYIESTDGQHVIFSGASDYSNGVTTALVFNTDHYSYHSFGIYLNDISPNKNTPITNATNNL